MATIILSEEQYDAYMRDTMIDEDNKDNISVTATVSKNGNVSSAANDAAQVAKRAGISNVNVKMATNESRIVSMKEAKKLRNRIIKGNSYTVRLKNLI